MKESKPMAVPAVEHQPKPSIIEMKINIGDLNPMLADNNTLFISLPAVKGQLVDISMQIDLEDKLGKRHFEMLEERLRSIVNAAIIAHMFAERMEVN